MKVSQRDYESVIGACVCVWLSELRFVKYHFTQQSRQFSITIHQRASERPRLSELHLLSIRLLFFHPHNGTLRHPTGHRARGLG